jgi:hypothetical protein
MLFRVVCSDGHRFSLVIQGDDVTFYVLKREILEAHLRVTKRYALESQSDVSQTIVSLKDYHGFFLSLKDDTSCTILQHSDPNPLMPTIGVIFQSDVDILRARFPDQSLMSMFDFCGKRASFEFQARPDNMQIEVEGSRFSFGKLSILPPSGSKKGRRQCSTGGAAVEHIPMQQSTAATKLLGGTKTKRRRGAVENTAIMLEFEADDHDSSSHLAAKRRKADDGRSEGVGVRDGVSRPPLRASRRGPKCEVCFCTETHPLPSERQEERKIGAYPLNLAYSVRRRFPLKPRIHRCFQRDPHLRAAEGACVGVRAITYKPRCSAMTVAARRAPQDSERPTAAAVNPNH